MKKEAWEEGIISAEWFCWPCLAQKRSVHVFELFNASFEHLSRPGGPFAKSSGWMKGLQEKEVQTGTASRSKKMKVASNQETNHDRSIQSHIHSRAKALEERMKTIASSSSGARSSSLETML